MNTRMTSLRKILAATALGILANGCKVGPNYSRPALNVPDQYRGVAPDLAAPVDGGDDLGERLSG